MDTFEQKIQQQEASENDQGEHSEQKTESWKAIMPSQTKEPVFEDELSQDKARFSSK